MATKNIAADVRSARLVATSQALVLINPELPSTTRTRITNYARAARILATTDQLTLMVDACAALVAAVKEAVPQDTTWVEAIEKQADSLVSLSRKGVAS